MLSVEEIQLLRKSMSACASFSRRNWLQRLYCGRASIAYPLMTAAFGKLATLRIMMGFKSYKFYKHVCLIYNTDKGTAISEIARKIIVRPVPSTGRGITREKSL